MDSNILMLVEKKTSIFWYILGQTLIGLKYKVKMQRLCISKSYYWFCVIMTYNFLKSSGLEMHTEIFMSERIWTLRLSLKHSRKNKEVKTDKNLVKH